MNSINVKKTQFLKIVVFILFETGSHTVIQAGLELTIAETVFEFKASLLPQLPKYWDYRHEITLGDCFPLSTLSANATIMNSQNSMHTDIHL